MVYASSTLSLAALELLVHVDPATAPNDLVALEIELPATAPVAVLDAAALPADWRAPNAPAACHALGDAFVTRARHLMLDVPSVIIPGERNCLLSPHHPDMALVTVRSREPFAFDPRLLHRAAYADF